VFSQKSKDKQKGVFAATGDSEEIQKNKEGEKCNLTRREAKLRKGEKGALGDGSILSGHTKRTKTYEYRTFVKKKEGGVFKKKIGGGRTKINNRSPAQRQGSRGVTRKGGAKKRGHRGNKKRSILLS